MDGPGYRFLCDKLKDGIIFYIIADLETGLPYHFINQERIFFTIYSDYEAAMAKCDELALNKRYAIPTHLETTGWAEQLWKRYRDLGVTYILLDNSVWVSISDLTATATYEGILSFNTPLRNPTLNAIMYCAIMYCYRQDVIADSCTYAMAALFWEALKNSKFYAPLRPSRALRPRETLNGNNFNMHYISLQDGRKAFLLFTDNEFKSIYTGNTNLKFEEHKVVNLFAYDDIFQLIFSERRLCAVINAYCGGFCITPESIEEFESISLNQSALQNNFDSKAKIISALDFNHWFFESLCMNLYTKMCDPGSHILFLINLWRHNVLLSYQQPVCDPGSQTLA